MNPTARLSAPTSESKKAPSARTDGKGITVNDLSISLPDGGQVRKTADGKASVFDLLKLAGAKSAAEVFKRLSAEYPDSVTNCDFIKFPRSDGRIQAKPTPVCDAAGWRRIMTVLPGVIGKAYRAAANELVDQYLSDPETLARPPLPCPGACW